MDNQPDEAPQAIVAALEYLTGPSRGTVSWLGASAVDVFLNQGRFIRVSPSRPGDGQGNLVGRLYRAENTYEIETPEGQSIWVNGVRAATKRLDSGDMIEFGETGPLSRFRLYSDGGPMHKTIAEIMKDCVDYLRISRQPISNRVYRASSGLLWQLTSETTVLFRISVLIAIALLAGLGYQQYRLGIRLQESIESSAARLDSVAAAAARAREEALRPSDLTDLRQEFAQRLSLNVERLDALEQRSQATERVIAGSTASVAFLQGAYGFRDRESGRMLRHAVNEDGLPLISPRGQPLLLLEGDGPVVELQFTGTGFVIGENGALLTNRHVGLPWENDAVAGAITGENLEAVMTKFVAYLPGKADAVPVELLLASETADLALLRRADESERLPGLQLADAPPARGDEVIVMGYPTGLRSMLAQSGGAFIEELQKTETTGFWSVAARLAEAGYIAPLASRGIVGQATLETIVYDAETTHGGSGGPVLDMNGEVVAVNSAILPEYGGSNLGVPAAKVRALLEEAGLR
jgi:S1-C subfamily serine protease